MSTAKFSRAPVAWDLLLALVAAKLVFHAVSNGLLTWGYMTDELYFLDSSARLQWGYVDHPPLSIAVLALLRPLTGDGIFAIPILPALLGAGTIVLSGLIARELGGGRSAQGLAGCAALATPVVLVMSSYYSMNAFDELLWPLGTWLLLRIINGDRPWLWLVLGVVMGAGMLTKVSMLWFGAGVGVGLVLTPERRWLRSAWPWAAGLIALIMFAPYVLWNYQNDWPFLEFSRNAAHYKVGEVSLLDFVAQQMMAMGYVAAPLWLGGIAFVFVDRAARRYRPVAWLFLTTAAILAWSGSARPHYLAPAFPIAFGCGAVLAERLAARWRWVPRAVAITLLVTFAVAAPIATPVLPPELTIRYEDALGLRPPEERERGGALPMHLGLFFHAEALLEPLSRVVASLSPAEREQVEILTGSFGETGGGQRAGAEARAAALDRPPQPVRPVGAGRRHRRADDRRAQRPGPAGRVVRILRAPRRDRVPVLHGDDGRAVGVPLPPRPQAAARAVAGDAILPLSRRFLPRAHSAHGGGQEGA